MGFLGIDVKKTSNTTYQTDQSVNTDNSVSADNGGVNVGAAGNYTRIDGSVGTAQDALEVARQAGNNLADNAAENAWLQLFLAQTGIGAMGQTSSQAMRQMYDLAGSTSANAMKLSDRLGMGALDAAAQIAGSNVNIAGEVNAQNTGLLASLGDMLRKAFGLSGQQVADTAYASIAGARSLAADSIAGSRSLAADSIAGARAMGLDLLNYGADLTAQAMDSADRVVQSNNDITRVVSDQYSRLADSAIQTAAQAQASNQELAKVVNTGGQSDVNKTFLWLGIAAAAVFALFALARKP